MHRTQNYITLVDRMWLDSKIMAPLETRYAQSRTELSLMCSWRLPFDSNPHPFISLLEPAKGKRLLPRLLRLLDVKRGNLFFTLLVACYRQLDVVRMAPILDQPDPTPAKREAEIQYEIFATTVIPACETILHRAPMRFVTGILGLLLDGGDVLHFAQTAVSSITRPRSDI